MRAVADLLRSLRRGPDMLGRHDGDCFVLVALHCDRSGAESLARRILQGLLGLPPPYASASVPWRARIGISTDRSTLVEDPKDLVDEGWKALEEAKRHANDVAFSEEPT